MAKKFQKKFSSNGHSDIIRTASNTLEMLYQGGITSNNKKYEED